MPDEPLVRVRGLKKFYPGRAGGTVRAVDDVSFDLARGEVLGLVGESGSGKTTLGRCLIRAIDPTDGEVALLLDSGERCDIARADKATLRRLRPMINMVFQDPFASLSPRMTVRDIIGEPLRAQGSA
jgi:peptide/nickel transport system ATP-binding protein